MGIIESDKFGGIRTERGPVGYVLQSGERITLGPRGEHLWKGEKPWPADIKNYIFNVFG